MKILPLGIAILLLGGTGLASANADSKGGDRGDRGEQRHADRHHGDSVLAASTVQAPEIQASTMIAALTLLGGGLFVLRGWRASRSAD